MNDNGLDEIIVTAKGGYVYGFELADKDPPRVEFSNLPKNKVVKVGDLTVNIHAEDQGRITSVEVKIDDNEWIYASKIDENEFTATITIDSPGIHIIKARATDHNGLRSPEISAEIVVSRPEKSKPAETENYIDKNTNFEFYYSLLQTFSALSLLSLAFLKRYRKKK
ncbi:MAG: Ig-like domain-containing protein [Candidatus Asgardarchaeia archaeon]